MFECLEGGAPGTAEQLTKRRLSRAVHAQDMHVDKVAYDGRELRSVTPGARCANEQVVLAAPTIEQRGVAGEKQRMKGGALLTSEVVESSCLRLIESDLAQRPVECLHRGPRPVG